MKSHRFPLRMVASAVALALPLWANAAGLGKLTVNSALGQPLSAEIELLAVDKGDLESLQANLASGQAFKDAQIEYAAVLSTLQFAVDKRSGGRSVLKITSSRAVNDPFLDILIELNWASGRLLREYTVLLDPPGVAVPQTVSPVAISVPSTKLPVAAMPATTAKQQTPTPATQTSVAAPKPDAAQVAQPEPKKSADTRSPSEVEASVRAEEAALAQAALEREAMTQAKQTSAQAKQTSAQAKQTSAQAKQTSAQAKQTKTEPVATKSAPVSSDQASAENGDAGGFVVVKRGDTLGKIANEVRPAEISLEEALVGLFRENPQAFEGGNMNRLKVGSKLYAPTGDSMKGVNAETARREVRLQAADWQAYRTKLAAHVESQTAPEAEKKPEKEVATGKVTPKVEDKTQTQSDSKDVLKLSRTAPATASTTTKQTQAEASKAAQDKAAKDKAAKLAADKAAADKAAAEKVAAEKAAAEKIAAAKAMAGKTAAEKLAAEKAAKLAAQKAAAEKVAAEKAAAEKAAAEKLAAEKAAKLAAEKAAADKAIAEQEERTASEKAATEAEERAAMLEKQIADLKKLEEMKDAAPAETQPVSVAPKVAAKPPVEEAEASSWLDGLKQNPIYWLGGLGALVLGGALWWMMAGGGRRKKAPLSFDDSGLVGDDLSPNSVMSAASGGAVNTGETSFLTDFSQAGLAAVDTHDVDPIAEADVYMAYGRDTQAEEILREALVKAPGRHEIRLKLLEIHAARKNLTAFENVAGELHVALAGKADPIWDKATKLGLSIDPSNPLYGGTAAVVAAPITVPVAPVPVAAAPAPVAEPVKVEVAQPATKEAEAGMLDFNLDEPASEPTKVEPAKAEPFKIPGAIPEDPPTLGISLDFDMSSFDNVPADDAQVETRKEPEAATAGSMDFSGLDLNLEDMGDEDDLDEVSTKLDLARAYLEMGDKEGAREILKEVISEGNDSQKADANSIMSSL